MKVLQCMISGCIRVTLRPMRSSEVSGTERTAERIIIEYEPAPTKGKEKNRWFGQVILRAYFKLLS